MLMSLENIYWHSVKYSENYSESICSHPLKTTGALLEIHQVECNLYYIHYITVLIAAFQYLMGTYEKDGEQFFAQSDNDKAIN